MDTALDKLKRMWADKSYRAALKLAASWPRLGSEKPAITKGWAAASNPDFYRQLGQDPQRLYTLGLLAVARRYKLGRPTTTKLH